MKSVLVGVLLCGTLLWARSGHKPPELLAITNVSVVDTRYGEVEPNLTVVVKDGVIIAIAKVAIIDSGPHVRVINGAGEFLIPGLWDMNAHLSGASATSWDRKSLYGLYIANGVTGLRDLQLDEDALPLDPLRPEIAASGNAPATQESPLNERPTVENLSEVLVACSSRERELRESFDPEAIPDTTAEVMLSRQVRESYDSKKAWNLFVKMSNHATWMVPGLVSIDGAANSVSEIGGDPRLKYLPSTLRAERKLDDLFGLREEMKEEAERDLALVSEMRRAGVQFLAGTNGPSTNSFPGFSLHQELDLLVKGGFTPLQALQTATFNPALYMAKLDRYGVVERGRIANLVLLEANPLSDIRNTQKISGVVLRGTYLSRSELDGMLAHAEQWANHTVDTAQTAVPHSNE
jgi:hypothetical protein